MAQATIGRLTDTDARPCRGECLTGRSCADTVLPLDAAHGRFAFGTSVITVRGTTTMGEALRVTSSNRRSAVTCVTVNAAGVAYESHFRMLCTPPSVNEAGPRSTWASIVAAERAWVGP